MIATSIYLNTSQLDILMVKIRKKNVAESEKFTVINSRVDTDTTADFIVPIKVNSMDGSNDGGEHTFILCTVVMWSVFRLMWRTKKKKKRFQIGRIT